MAVVIKKDGSTETFDSEKLRQSLFNAGASEETVDEVTDNVAEEIADDIVSTEEIREIVIEELVSRNSRAIKDY